MCGIAGILRYDSDQRIEPAVLQEMTRRLRHRGPDDEAVEVSGRVGLGHTRLSIIDLSPRGHQPFKDEAGRYTLVYNGEIYNYLELRAWLESRGHRFRSRTDTEVVLRGYMEIGPACVERLIGMFAFALWDAESETLFLARDRMGEKPLVYADLGGSISFASEIQSLLADPDVPRDPDVVGLLAYLATGKCVPYPRTAYAHIKKLPPAHTMTVDRKGIRLHRYWEPDFSRKSGLDLHEAVEALDDLLRRTVSSMMMSDVPVGLLLSGGVDSSSIAFEMRACTERMMTFTCGNSPSDEEFLRARAVAARLGTRHFEHIFALRPETMLRTLQHFGEPIAEPSVLYRLQMCEFLRSQGVTVILTGNGADEVFGGYSSYSLLRRFPLAKRALARLFAPGSPLRAVPGVDTRLLPRIEVHGLPVPLAFGDAFARKMRGNLARLACPHPAAEGAVEEVRDTLVHWLQWARVDDVVDGALFADLMVILHHNHVMIPDGVGMSQSLEIRSPFLDTRLVEFAAALPSVHKVSRDPAQNKTILKRLLERHLPNNLVYAGKIGYGGNIRYLEKHAEYWSRLLRRIVVEGGLGEAGLVGEAVVPRLLEAPIAGTGAGPVAVLPLVMLGLWWDRSCGTGMLAESLDDAAVARSQIL